MGPLIVKYGVAYKEASASQEREPEERFECDFNKSDDVVRRAMQLLDGGKLSVIMFSYFEGIDTTSLKWDFVKQNEFLPESRESRLSSYQKWKEELARWQPGGQYPQGSFQTAQEEKDWHAEILSGVMELVRSSDEPGYIFREQYYGKHPEAQGSGCNADKK